MADQLPQGAGEIVQKVKNRWMEILSEGRVSTESHPDGSESVRRSQPSAADLDKAVCFVKFLEDRGLSGTADPIREAIKRNQKRLKLTDAPLDERDDQATRAG